MGRRSQISGLTLSTVRKGSVIEMRSATATGSPAPVRPNQGNETPNVGFHSTNPDPVAHLTLCHYRDDIKYEDDYR